MCNSTWDELMYRAKGICRGQEARPALDGIISSMRRQFPSVGWAS
jgi:hypothetical protein